MVEILIIILIALILSNGLAARFRLVGPIVLIVVGSLVSFIPHLPRVEVESEIILSVFLPLLLYWEALNISLRGIKRALRGIVISGTLMVVFVAVSVGLVGQWIGFTLGTALLIGAAVGPTDATAVSALGRGISRAQMVVLRAESLINDGTALVVFALALEYAGEHQQITASHAIVTFLISFVGGAAIGFVGGWIIARVGAPIQNAMLGNLFRILTPLLIFFLAELIEASGVLAVVVCGLYMAQVGPRFQSTGSRYLARPFWGITTYILNSFLFFYVGYLLPTIARGLNSDTLTHAVWGTVVLYFTMLLARMAFMEITIRGIRLLDRRPQQKKRRTTFRSRLVSDLAGFRGGISLAVALSIPITLADGEAFPFRDVIIFVTSGIVILSLVVQGALLPLAVQALERAPAPNYAEDPEAEDREVRAAMIDSMRDVYKDFDQIVVRHNVSPAAAEKVKAGWEKQRDRWLKMDPDNREEKVSQAKEEMKELQLALIRERRQHMIRYRDEGKIDDEALIRLLDITDMDEIRLTGPVEME